MTRDAFFPGSCNQAALAEIDRAAEWDGLPRLLHGPARSGKSHLAAIFAEATGAALLDATDLHEDRIADLARAPALALDRAERLAATPRAETVAFHLLNQSRDLARPTLIAGRGLLGGWGLRLPDLASRLAAARPLTLTAPDEVTLRMVLAKSFADRQLAVAPKVLEYAATRVERSFDAVSALVAALDRASLHEHRPITMSLVRDSLRDPAPAAPPSDTSTPDGDLEYPSPSPRPKRPRSTRPTSSTPALPNRWSLRASIPRAPSASSTGN